MTNRLDLTGTTAAPVTAPTPSDMTPAGIQSTAVIARRRSQVIAVNVATYVVMLAVAAHVMSAGGWTVIGAIMFACFAVGTPWTVLGFWNAVIGLWLLHGGRNAIAEVAPFMAAGDEPTPITTSTAILMTLRNEDPARAIRRLRTVKASVDATGEGGAFSYYLLSDTNNSEVAAKEEAEVARWQAEDGDRDRIVYRRRAVNTGFKAGNVRDFCETYGRNYELMLPLDADSVMGGDAIVKMVRMMQAYPKLGILQSLVVGMPSASAFARIFQFGMRHGMRSYTMGQVWWTADCGPFWGHNAVVRIAPFRDACHLPVIPGGPPFGGHVLSHDQVEATLMRRAGYEVRVLPVENGSWEENPPTMLDFMVRDVRWCQGNLQYTRLLDIPGLLPMSRFQLVWAILMFVGLPAWTLMIALLPFAAWHFSGVPEFPSGAAIGLYVAFFAMYLSPKFAGLIDAVLTPGEVARFGGPLRFTLSAVIELVFSFLQGAVSTIRTTVFMITLLATGKSVVWGGQSRDAYGVSWRTAVENLWPQMLFGALVCGALWLISPTTLLWSLPLTAGYLLAVPFCVLTSDPALGASMKRAGIAGIPEDFDTPDEVRAVMAAG
ncbi:MAG: glucans biosynthesis glucosyltransferase MdoH [Hyphomicrobiaceae bacterium]|nr:glucans biosynthesis glucosyltransferase MdoH [Hyphomicrobiaceae bacterium]